MTEKDLVLARVRRFIMHGWPDQESGEDITPYLRMKDELSVLDGCVLWGSRVVIPPQDEKL